MTKQYKKDYFEDRKLKYEKITVFLFMSSCLQNFLIEF